MKESPRWNLPYNRPSPKCIIEFPNGTGVVEFQRYWGKSYVVSPTAKVFDVPSVKSAIFRCLFR